MKFAAFDIELANPLPDGKNVWEVEEFCGISCAAIALSDKKEILTFTGDPQLTTEESKSIVSKLQSLKSEGYEIVTWNGCAFDFAVLAEESELVNECADLAYNHIDLMLIVTFTKGHYLALEKALKGAGLSGKTKTITLKDGSIITEMNGKMAPELWQLKEYEAVLTYLKEDVSQLLKLSEIISKNKNIKWRSEKGNPQLVSIEQLYSVKECFSLPLPDTSWMTNPPKRKKFIEWIPDEVYEKISIEKTPENIPKEKTTFLQKLLNLLVLGLAFVGMGLAKVDKIRAIMLVPMILIGALVGLYYVLFWIIKKLKPNSSKWFHYSFTLQGLIVIEFIGSFFLLDALEIQLESYIILLNLVSIPLFIWFYFDKKILASIVIIIYELIGIALLILDFMTNIEQYSIQHLGFIIGTSVQFIMRMILIITLSSYVISFQKINKKTQ